MFQCPASCSDSVRSTETTLEKDELTTESATFLTFSHHAKFAKNSTHLTHNEGTTKHSTRLATHPVEPHIDCSLTKERVTV